MQVRPRVSYGANDVRDAMPGEITMSQLKVNPLATVGAGQWTPALMLGGIIERSGPVGGYADTLPTVAELLAACPNLSVGDSFTILFKNTVAQAMTMTAGTGFTLGTNVNTAASLVREYLVTILSNRPASVFSCTTTNGSAVLTNVPAAAIDLLQPQMLVTGTGIQANSTILAVNALAGTVTLSLTASATANNIAATANPTATIEGVRSSTA